jgi:hypothetical protein
VTPRPARRGHVRRPNERPRSRFALLALLVSAAALAAAPAADAHVRSGLVAVDYRASVFPLRDLGRALSLRIFTTDRALALTVRRGRAVTVLGYLGEPFSRIDDNGVLVNEASPTSAAAGLLRRTQPVGERAPRWVLRSRGRTIVWHTASLRGLPRR